MRDNVADFKDRLEFRVVEAAADIQQKIVILDDDLVPVELDLAFGDISKGSFTAMVSVSY